MNRKARFLSILLSLVLACLCAGAGADTGILPVLQTPPPEDTYAISLHSATGAAYSSLSTAEGGGYKYNYSDVSYACYTLFSTKLAEEGYILVSSEMLEDGTSRAVVTNGTVTLVMDYNLESKTASVSYPPSVFARDPDLNTDYTEIRDGGQFQVTGHVTAAVTGWNWAGWFYNRYNDKYVYSGDGTNYIYLHMDVSYFRPEETDSRYLLKQPELYYDGQPVENAADARGMLSMDGNTPRIYNSSSYKNKMESPYAMVFKVTDEQVLHPEKIAITFTDYDNAVRYVYYPAATLAADYTGIWKGTATASDAGEPFDLTVEIRPDGNAMALFTVNESLKRIPFTFSETEKNFTMYVSTAGIDKADVSWEAEGEALQMDIGLILNDGSTMNYAVALQKAE